MAQKKVARAQSRSTTEGKAAKAPAEVLRASKAKIAEALKTPIPRLGLPNPALTKSVDDHAQARRAIAEMPVTMTLGQVCTLLGRDIEPGTFASSALASFADQIETVAVICDTAPEFSSDAWRLFQNLAQRAEYASKVVSWLESGKPAEMAEAQS